MAKPKKPAPKGKAVAKGGRKPINSVMVLLLIMAMIPFSLPTMMVLVVGMLPTMVAAYTDRGNYRYAWLAVGGTNFAGVAPYLFGMWFGVHTLTEAITILTSVPALLVMFGGAGMGWALYSFLPSVVRSFLAITEQRRLGRLREQQKKLVAKWGEQVTMSEEEMFDAGRDRSARRKSAYA